MPLVTSIQVARPHTYGTDGAEHPMDRPWTSAIGKQPVSGPVMLRRTNLDGDRQADLVAHGGPEKAVLAYSAGHYPDWREELGRDDFPHGAFGENLTIEGQDEGLVCIGDTYAIGDAVVQVSQPRVPCFKLAYRWRIKDLTARVQRSRRPGWYLRVLQEGSLEAGDLVRLVERAYPEWTVSRTILVGEERHARPREAAELAECHLLTAAWRDWLREAAA
jgi:MOSC domain-containing protein YiiM